MFEVKITYRDTRDTRDRGYRDTRGRNLEGIVLCEISLTEGEKCYVISFIYGI